jgi:fructokinase
VRIGIDLGGTKIEGIALDDHGQTRVRRRITAPRGEYGDTLRAVSGLVATIESELTSVATVGVGIPGTISPATGLVKNSNSTWLNGTRLAHDLPKLLERPVRFANDANCFALSEATDGAAAGASTVFGVIVGTGTGGGIAIDGRVLVGSNAIAGEWGHNSLPWPRPGESPGIACYCGRSGCIETFLSGPGMSRDYQTASGTPATPEEIVAAAARGELNAIQCLERYEDRFARALASVINVVDPDVIVLGGGLSNVDRLYSTIPSRLGAFVFSDVIVTRVVRAMHGDSSGVRGAAWLWPRGERRC